MTDAMTRVVHVPCVVEQAEASELKPAWAIMVGRQKIQVGLPHDRKT